MCCAENGRKQIEDMSPEVTNTSSQSVQRLLASAIAHQQRAEYGDAARLYRQVLDLQPNQPEALHLLGLVMHQTGRTTEADELLQQSLARTPGNAGFHYNYARVLAEDGRPQEAVSHYQRALELNPTYGDAWHGLALALRVQGHPEDAVACWERGLSANRRQPAAWCELARTQQSLGLLPEAVAAGREALALIPNDPEIGTLLASLLIESRAYDEADHLLDLLCKKHPDWPEAHYTKGVLLTNFGRFAEACAEFEAALRLAPDFYQAAVHLVAIKRFSPSDLLAKQLQTAVQKGAWHDPGQGVNVHFCLGKIYQDDACYEHAFLHYLEGNRLRGKLLPYSPEAQQRFFESLKSAFDESFVKRSAACGVSSGTPIFIVGMPRSGTSLVEQILSSHPEVHGAGELMLLHAALRRRLGVDYRLKFAQSIIALENSDLKVLAEQCLAQMRALAPSAKYITDKLPSNFMLLGLIHSLFPKARIIYCRRNPLDTCVSCFTTLFKSGHEFTSDLRHLATYYCWHTELMAHWKRLLPPESLLELHYEELVKDPENQSSMLLTYLGLTWDPACLKFNKAPRPVSTASVYQVRQPVYQSAIGRWRHYADHLEPVRRILEDCDRPVLS